MKQIFAVVMLAVVCLLAHPVSATTYYVSGTGNDNNTGTATNAAWLTITKVNAQTLSPGDQVLFQASNTFGGCIRVTNIAATAAAPVVFSSYGLGRASITNANNTNGFYAINCSGMIVSNLNFAGAGRTVNTGSGIEFNDNAASNRLASIIVDQVDVSGYGNAGIYVHSKTNKAFFTDVRVTHANVHDINTIGIHFDIDNHLLFNAHSNIYIGYCTVSNVTGYSGTANTGNGIRLGGCNSALIERCLAVTNCYLGGGAAAIWCWNSTNVTVQYCEAHHNGTASTQDGDGFDIDGGSTGCLFQYNYSHDNAGAGFLLCTFDYAPLPTYYNVIRYNISQNDGRKNNYPGIYLYNGQSHYTFGLSDAQIYNNVIYVTPASSGTARCFYISEYSTMTVSNIYVRNNIFISTNGAPLVYVPSSLVKNVLFQGNDYWPSGGTFNITWAGTAYSSLSAFRSGVSGQEKIGTTNVGIQSDPLFLSAGGGGTIGDPTLLSTLTAYQTQSTSPCRETGLNLNALFGINIGSQDFYGDAVPNGLPDIGAYDGSSCTMPTPNASNNGPVCAGTTLSLSTPTVTGATYSWTGPNSFTSSAQNPTVSTSATTAMAGTYYVTVTTNGCTSAQGSTTVTVNSPPPTPTAGNSGPVCVGTALTLTTPTVSGATYGWTGPNSFTSSAQNPTVSTSATLGIAGTYYVTVTVSGCTSAAGSTTVTVNAIPSTPTAGNNGPVCEGTALTLSTPTVTGATYSWTGPSSFTSSAQNPTVSSSATLGMAGTYYVTVTVSGCTSAAGSTTVTVNAIPSTPTAGNNGPVCEGTALTLSTPTVSGATYSWTGPGSFTSLAQNPTVSSSATLAMAGTYYVTVTVGGCTSAAGSTAVTVNAVPSTPSASNSGPVCEGTALSLSTPTVSGATYSWTGPDSYSSSDQNPTVSSSATTNMAGTYYVTVTVGGCTSAVGSTAATVNGSAAAPSITTDLTNQTVCAGTEVTWVVVASGTGQTYQWQRDGTNLVEGVDNFTGTTSDTLTNSAVSAADSVTADHGYACVVGTCASATNSSMVSLTVNANPTVSVNSPTVCASDLPATITATPAGGTGPYTYAWTVPSGASDPGNVASFGATVAGTYSVVVSDANGCSSASGSGTLTVNEIPSTPTAGNNGPVCEGTALTLSTPTVSGATYSWTGLNSYTSSDPNPTVSSSATLAMAGTYYVTVTVSGCTSVAGSTVVTVDATSVGGTASPTSAHIYSGGSTNIALSGETGAIVKWQSSTDGGANWSDIASTANPLPTGTLTQTTEYRAVVQSEVCSTDTSSVATVTVSALQAPTLGVPQWLGANSVKLTFSGPEGQTYNVRESTDVTLLLSSWNILTNGTFGSDAATYTDTDATNVARFYRILSP